MKYDFDKFQKIAIKIHNIHVKREKSKIKDNPGLATIYQNLLFDANDTAQLMLLKSLIFWIDLKHISKQIDAVASQPEWHLTKPSFAFPSVAIVYRTLKKTRSGNYQLTIPHYNGVPIGNIPSYKKGNHCLMLVLKDNSRLTVNASTEAEGTKVLNHLKTYINRNFIGIPEDIRHIERKGLKNIEVVPVRADFYPSGTEGGISKRQYF